MNGIFMPMFWIGLAGVSRRLYDGGTTYDIRARTILRWNRLQLVVGLAPRASPDALHLQLLLEHARTAEGRRRNPWQSTTVEWQAPSPPPHGNFDHAPDASTAARTTTARAGLPRDFIAADAGGVSDMAGLIPYITEPRPDTGLNNGKIGIWLFLASEVMLFGALLRHLHRPAHRARRAGRAASEILNVPLATRQHRRADHLERDHGDGLGVAQAATTSAKFRLLHRPHRACSASSSWCIKYFEYSAKFEHRPAPEHEHLPGDLLHHHRPARPARDRRHGRERLLLGPGPQLWETRSRALHQPGRELRACSGTSSTWSGSSSFPILYLL